MSNNQHVTRSSFAKALEAAGVTDELMVQKMAEALNAPNYADRVAAAKLVQRLKPPYLDRVLAEYRRTKHVR